MIKFIKFLRFLLQNEKSLRQLIKKQDEIDLIRSKYPDVSISDSNYFVVENFEMLKFENDVVIGPYNVFFILNYDKSVSNSGLYVKEGTYIGEQNNIRAAGARIFIGRKCLISQQVSLIAANHEIKKGHFIKDQPWASSGDINIEDDVWIGCGVQVMPGVTIGKGAVVAAGSVVTKSVDPYTVVAGVPAKKISERV